jgi:hypothetical protein
MQGSVDASPHKFFSSPEEIVKSYSWAWRRPSPPLRRCVAFSCGGSSARDTSGPRSGVERMQRPFARCSCCTPFDSWDWYFSFRVWSRQTCRMLRHAADLLVHRGDALLAVIRRLRAPADRAERPLAQRDVVGVEVDHCPEAVIRCLAGGRSSWRATGRSEGSCSTGWRSYCTGPRGEVMLWLAEPAGPRQVLPR